MDKITWKNAYGFSFQAAEKLDELLKIFSPEEITANIGLLSHSIEHIKIRVAELTALKSEPISPNLLNMSESKFKLYLNEAKNKWIDKWLKKIAVVLYSNMSMLLCVWHETAWFVCVKVSSITQVKLLRFIAVNSQTGEMCKCHRERRTSILRVKQIRKFYCSRIIISKGVFLSERYFVCVRIYWIQKSKQPNTELCVQ